MSFQIVGYTLVISSYLHSHNLMNINLNPCQEHGAIYCKIIAKTLY